MALEFYAEYLPNEFVQGIYIEVADVDGPLTKLQLLHADLELWIEHLQMLDALGTESV